MSYLTKQSDISRTKIRRIELDMDYCNNTYGTAPCTAADYFKCYNTFPTCQDQANFTKTTKTYKFIDHDLSIDLIRSFAPAKPYIKSIGEIPTEIKEDTTTSKRLSVELFDENDNDVGIDPYRSGRPKITGTFWKKFLARNRNYKGRIIRMYEGFDGLAEADFQLKFTGKIDLITIKEGVCTIEAISLLRSLKDIKYPLNINCALDGALPNLFSASSESDMLALSANLNDYCLRTDFSAIASPTTYIITSAGSLPLDRYTYIVVAYDAYDRPLARSGLLVETLITPGDQEIEISWSAYSGASYYRIFKNAASVGVQWKYYQLTLTDYFDADDSDFVTIADPPLSAVKYYQLTDLDPTVIGNWNFITADLTINVTDASKLEASGYIMVEKEIVYYSSITSNTLNGVLRMQLDTKAASHTDNTIIYSLIKFSPDNGFTHLKALLALAGLGSYVSTVFNDYETAGTTINFSTTLIIKSTTLAKIYFDLVNALDCISWDGEDGLIHIKKQKELPSSYSTLTDVANICIDPKPDVDLNAGARYTRWLLYWNRDDVTKAIDDQEGFNRLEELIDATAESANEYNDSIPDVQYTTWINTDCGTLANIQAYILDLLLSRQVRTRNAPEIITLSVEMKDGGIVTGDIVSLSTDELQDKDGNNYTTERFRLVRKVVKGNKIEFKLLRYFSTEDYVLLAEGSTYNGYALATDAAGSTIIVKP